jgi:hypothetical protein
MSSLITQIKPPVLFYPSFLNSADDSDWFQKSQQLEWTRGEMNNPIAASCGVSKAETTVSAVL